MTIIKSFKKLSLGLLALVGLTLAANMDANLNLADIVAVHGYAFEEHQIMTDDGYILRIFRIPGRMFVRDLTVPGPPVICAHGIIDSADGWVVNGEKSPAFILSDEGYDVWLINTRGNKYSKAHLFLDTNSEEFWDFSWEEVATYDLPAITDYILSVTRYQKLAYIGHSMGTTQSFYGLVQNLTYYQQKWSVFIALAPPVSMKNLTSSPMLKFLSDEKTVNAIIAAQKLTKNYEIMPSNWVNTGMLKVMCSIIYDICLTIEKFIADTDPSINDQTASMVYFSHYPSGSSLKQAVHFTQVIKSGKFNRYDYGKSRNMARYGQEEPPEMDISQIKDIPIVIIAGNQDLLSTLADTRWQQTQLNHTLVFYKEYDMGHLTYFTHKDMNYFKIDVMAQLKQYHPVPKPQYGFMQ